MIQSNYVAAVIITYHPDYQALNKLIHLLCEQVSRIYIVDNGSPFTIEKISNNDIHVIELAENMGIAYAQNVGLQKAKADGLTDFVLFDQDSLPSATLVADLLYAREQAQQEGIRVAAVGPVHIDHDSGEKGIFIDTTSGALKKIHPAEISGNGSKFAVSDFLIASGSLISLSSLHMVGDMESELFIDCVDIEWGFRAQSKGYYCIAALNAKMYHKIGDEPLKLFGRELTVHQPIRHYYFFRNFYHLTKRNYVPNCWKRYVFIKSSLQAVVFCLFLSNRLQHMKAISYGIFDAIRNKYGQY